MVVTNQAGKQRRSVTDALGRLTSVTEDPSGLNYLTSYSYDTLDNLTTVTQGAQTRTFVYDSLKRLTAATNPESGTISYQYDADGNLTQKTDARGVQTTYAYDALNRVTTRSYSDGTPTVTYAYDTLTNGIGRLTSVSSSVSQTSYGQYDALGRVKQSTQTIDGQSYSLSYAYNLAGALTAETYPSGRIITTSYDSAGRISSINGQQTGEATKTYASQFTYTAHGAVSSMQLANNPNLWEHTTFNNRLQPTQIGLGTSATDSSKLQLDYSYGTTNNNGNVQSQTITIAGGTVLTQSYAYDSLNRLQSATETNGGVQSWKQTYVYDRYGNRTFDAANTTSPNPLQNPSINSANNRIADNQGYGYDTAGNLTSAPSQTFGYDGENHQTSYQGGNLLNGGATYSYDGDGKRVKKVTASGTTIFVYDASGQMVAEYTTATQQGSGGTSYLTSDSLGTPRIITDASGNVKARHDYLPFGEEISAGVGGRTTGQGYVVDNVTIKFTSKLRDDETGLDYFGARYYSSPQARFTTVDPMLSSEMPAQPQSWNRYVYCVNNPLKYKDSTGLIWGYYTDQQNQGHYHWFKDKNELEQSGATVVENFIYKAWDGSWIRLNPEASTWGVFESQGQAVENTHGPLGDNSTVTDQAFGLALSDTGGRIAANLFGRAFSGILGSFFSRTTTEAAESTFSEGLIGVPKAPLDRVLARLRGLRLGDTKIVDSVEAFGSRAGSTFRGRGPLPGSDLDLMIDIHPSFQFGRSAGWIDRTLSSIASDFEKEAGFKLNFTPAAAKKGLQGTPFIPLK